MGDTGEGRHRRAWVLCALLGMTGLSGAQAASPASQLRCGWWQNPTPGNAWLNDRHGRWTVGSQGAPRPRATGPASPRRNGCAPRVTTAMAAPVCAWWPMRTPSG